MMLRKKQHVLSRKEPERLESEREVCDSNDDGSKVRDVGALQIYLGEIRFSPRLSAEEENCLACRAKQGDRQARNQLIQGSLRLVVKVARSYQRFGIDLADLIEEGNLGLIHAVEKFDVTLGYRLSTYATWWIRHYIEKFIMDRGKLVRLPVYLEQNLAHYRKEVNRLTSTLGRKPSTREIAESLKMEPGEIDDLMNLDNGVVSMDAANSDENGRESNLLDSLVDVAQLEAEQQIYLETLKQIIDGWLMQLSLVQREVIARRFGLMGHERGTLEEIGCVMGLNREKVRNIQNTGLKRLREIMIEQGLFQELEE